MGAVYEAVDTSSHPNRRVAIKELSQSNLSTAAEVQRAKNRFRLEGDMLRSLNHPNLPRVYASFEEGNRLYLVMDFIQGQTLLELLQASYGRPLPIDQVLNYACQLCDVLSYLHRQFPPIIFRDLKPSNVMVTNSGHIYLIDFGIARFFKPGKKYDTEAFGSFVYASPQQLDGSQTSVASDLYSLGATLHHCLTGKMPGHAQNSHRYPSARSINPLVTVELDRLIASLVEVKEHKRPQSADTVLHTLCKLKAQVETPTPEYVQSSASSPWANTHGIGPLILPGDTSNILPDDQTFNIKSPPAPTEPLPDWMIGVREVFKRLWVWLLPLLLLLGISLGEAGRTAFVAIRGAITRRKLPKITRADIQRGFAQVGQGIVRGYQQVRLAVSSWSSRVLTPKFVAVLLLRLALLIVLTILGVRIFGSYTIVAFGLVLLLLVITGSASISTRVRDPIARSLLSCTALAMLIACIALQATTDVQAVLHTVTFGHLLSVVLVAGACISLLRTTNRLTWVDYVTMVFVTATCALLQFTLFSQEFQNLSGNIIDVSSLVRDTLTSVLALIAFLFLCRVTRSFSGFDRFMLLLVAIVYASLQFAFGFDELQHLWFFAQMSSSSDTLLYAGYVYIVLIGVPLISALVALFMGRRHALANRIAIFSLAIACALLQSALAQNVAIFLPAAPPVQPLMIRLVDLFTSSQFFMYGGLSLATLLLAVRLGRPLTWLERPALFLLASACALLQSTFWTNQMLQFPSDEIGSATLGQVSVIAFNQLLASILFLLAFVGASIAIIRALVRVARHNASINQRATTMEHRFTWVQGLTKLVDRLIILGIMLVSTLLVAFFADQSQLLAQTLPLQGHNMTISVGQIASGILALLAIVALFRLKRPFNRWDCITLLLAIIADVSLAYGNTSIQNVVPPLLSRLQQFTDTFLSGNGPQLLLFAGLIMATGISLLWLRRTPPSPRLDAVLLFVLFMFFAGALLCVFLHYIWPVLLLAALLMLIHGIFVAIQMERVR